MAHRSIISFLTHEAPPSPDGGAATLAQALDARVREGELIERLPDHAVRCFACGHRCLVKPGRSGICKVRFNKDGTLYVPAGYVAALQCDPTEKKPFFHALPGSDTLTFGMLGCDFHCGYCRTGSPVRRCATRRRVCSRQMSLPTIWFVWRCGRERSSSDRRTTSRSSPPSGRSTCSRWRRVMA